MSKQVIAKKKVIAARAARRWTIEEFAWDIAKRIEDSTSRPDDLVMLSRTEMSRLIAQVVQQVKDRQPSGVLIPCRSGRQAKQSRAYLRQHCAYGNGRPVVV